MRLSTEWASDCKTSPKVVEINANEWKSERTNERMDEWVGTPTKQMNKQTLKWTWVRARLPALAHLLCWQRDQPRSHITCVLFIVNLKSHSRTHSNGPPNVPPKIKAQKMAQADNTQSNLIHRYIFIPNALFRCAHVTKTTATATANGSGSGNVRSLENCQIHEFQKPKRKKRL